MPILDADHLAHQTRARQGVIQIAQLPLIAVGVGVGTVELGVEVDQPGPLAHRARLLLIGLPRQLGEAGAHDLAALGGRIIVGQHPHRILHPVGVEIPDHQQIPRLLLESLPQHFRGGDPQRVAVPLPIQGIGAGIVGIVLVAGRALGLEVVDHQGQRRIPLG
ncbi:hypothetical protein D3C78_724170 [compost metagenome]